MSTLYDRKQEYAEKLRDPRWQKKRLEIFQRDGFKCRACGDKENELQVHHFKYAANPWEGEDKDKITMCKECHRRQKLKKELYEIVDDYVQDIDDDPIRFDTQLKLLVVALKELADHTSMYEIKEC